MKQSQEKYVPTSTKSHCTSYNVTLKLTRINSSAFGSISILEVILVCTNSYVSQVKSMTIEKSDIIDIINPILVDYIWYIESIGMS